MEVPEGGAKSAWGGDKFTGAERGAKNYQHAPDRFAFICKSVLINISIVWQPVESGYPSIFAWDLRRVKVLACTTQILLKYSFKFSAHTNTTSRIHTANPQSAALKERVQ